MKIRFVLSETPFNCQLEIADMLGTRTFMIDISDECENPSLEIDINGTEFDLTLTPIMGDYKHFLNDFETQKFADKLAKKLTGLLLKSVESTILRVGCKYHISGVQDMDTLNIDIQAYAFGTSIWADFFGIMPTVYMFYEVSQFNNRFILINAFETNRKSVLKSAKAFIIADFGIHLIFTYPFQIGVIKHLTKNKKIIKTLHKYHGMSEEERHKLMEKFEKD